MNNNRYDGGMSEHYTLFISDLHLAENQPQIITRFINFLQDEAPAADALYILGDLFEVWIGDDDDSDYLKRIVTALQHISQQIPVYFMVGNRDFLLGAGFAAKTGLKQLSDPTLINLYGQPVLLAHGDLLCIDDKLHQAFRSLTQNTWFKKIFSSLPLSWRKKLALKVRQQSKKRNQNLKPLYTDINREHAQQLLQQRQAQLLIHGHIHQQLTAVDEIPPRLVLDCWHPDHGNALFAYDDGHFSFKTICR